MLQRLPVEVASVGEHVVLAIGSSRWTFGYETALALSGRMSLAARSAKRCSGDFSHTWRALGTMHDAEKGPDYGQPFTPNKVYPVNRELTVRVGAKNEGALVVMSLGGDEARIPYQSAQVLGQWLRLRAKESKRRAGDARHWSKI